MVFTKKLRDGVRVGGRYPMDEGWIVVESIESILRGEITPELARESGFRDVDDLLEVARHGNGQEIFLIRFHYEPG
jgi:hypothetical protein